MWFQEISIAPLPYERSLEILRRVQDQLKYFIEVGKEGEGWTDTYNAHIIGT